MEYSKQFFENNFSSKRMERYFALYPNNEERAIQHYECNLMLSESLYVSLSVLEVTLRNALCRELKTMTNQEDWYSIIPLTPSLNNLERYINEATQHIRTRHEQITPSKIIAELTFGFWVSTPLNMFRRLRNRIFHNEPICWNLNRVEEIHSDMLRTIGWMNRDLPDWVREQERFDVVCVEIRQKMGWR